MTNLDMRQLRQQRPYTEDEERLALTDHVGAHLMREMRLAMERRDEGRQVEVWRRLLKHRRLPMWEPCPGVQQQET